MIDTGIFDQDRYFDVFVEYAKASPEDVLIQISVYNRGPEPAALHVLPTMWFRNLWSVPHRPEPAGSHRGLRRSRFPGDPVAPESSLGEHLLYCEGDADTAVHRERNQQAAPLRYAQSNTLREGRHQQLPGARPARGSRSGRTGSKASACYLLYRGRRVESQTLRLRLSDGAGRLDRADGSRTGPFGSEFERVLPASTRSGRILCHGHSCVDDSR